MFFINISTDLVGTEGETIDEAVQRLVDQLKKRGLIHVKYGDGTLPLDVVSRIPKPPRGCGIVFWNRWSDNIWNHDVVYEGCEVLALPFGTYELVEIEIADDGDYNRVPTKKHIQVSETPQELGRWRFAENIEEKEEHLLATRFNDREDREQS